MRRRTCPIRTATSPSCVRGRTRPIRTGHVALMLCESLLHVLDAVGSAPDRAAMAAGLAEALVLSVAAKSPHQRARPSSLAERR
jgi:hypothetical protein